jgi:hypothetical protein
MAGLSPAEFGRAFDKIQVAYGSGIGRCLAPVFHITALLLICYLLISRKRSNIRVRTDYRFANTNKWRWLVTSLVIIGFWYPTYIYEGFVFSRVLRTLFDYKRKKEKQ